MKTNQLPLQSAPMLIFYQIFFGATIAESKIASIFALAIEKQRMTQ
ncbi:hypothetical protein [Breznakibacter xylanolyticus]|nr:hypothetical protein [Breznakibacter xylanolyticus]